MTIIPFEKTLDGTLERYYYDREVVDLSPYMNIKRISRNAFKFCTSMKELILPDRNLTIEDGAFRECVNLEIIHCSSKIKNIEGNPFNNTKWFKNELAQKGYVVINNILLAINEKEFNSFDEYPDLKTIERINSSAFNSNESIKSLDFKKFENLKNIEPYSFYHCSSLETIDLGNCDKITEIQNQTFAFCPKLNKVILPKSISNIHAHAFRETPWFNTLIQDINGTKIAVYNNMLIKFIDVYTQDENNSTVKSLISSSLGIYNENAIDLQSIAPNIETICSRAFEFSGVSKVVLPERLMCIKDHAFNSCMNLSQVEFSNNIKYIENNAFTNCFKLNFDITTLPINTYVSETAFNKEIFIKI